MCQNLYCKPNRLQRHTRKFLDELDVPELTDCEKGAVVEAACQEFKKAVEPCADIIKKIKARRKK